MILLDLSRLISRAGRETPTGIDRVELAYAEHLIGGSTPLCFTMLTAAGRFGPLPRAAAEDYIQAIDRAWRGEGAAPHQTGRGQRLVRARRLGAPPRRAPARRASARSTAPPPAQPPLLP